MKQLEEAIRQQAQDAADAKRAKADKLGRIDSILGLHGLLLANLYLEFLKMVQNLSDSGVAISAVEPLNPRPLGVEGVREKIAAGLRGGVERERNIWSFPFARRGNETAPEVYFSFWVEVVDPPGGADDGLLKLGVQGVRNYQGSSRQGVLGPREFPLTKTCKFRDEQGNELDLQAMIGRLQDLLLELISMKRRA